MKARLVFGVPLFQAAEHLPEALESLLDQRGVNCAYVCVDDGRDEKTPEVVRRYTQRDPRLHYERNHERLGLALNWRRAFEVAVALHPEAEFFAWGSDHDVWHPHFAGRLVRALDRRPDAKLAYAREAVLTPQRALRRRTPCIDTTSIPSRAETVWRLAREMRAGQMVYGVFRIDAVHRAGGFRQVLFPDRLLLTEVALQGHLVEVPETMWYRRKTADFSTERQVRAIFPHGAPAWTRLPWWVTHACALARTWGAGPASLYLAANGSRAAVSRLPRR